MKRILRYIALSAAIICVQSCSKAEEGNTPSDDGIAILSLSADLPREPRSSDESGIANVDRTRFDLRFVFEIYDESGAFVKRMAINAGRQNTVNADFRLLAAKYTLLCWADFVTHGEANVGDLYYDTGNGLKKVAVKQESFIAMSNEAKAVYCTSVEVDLTSGNATLPGVTLRSPQAKLRLINKQDISGVESISLTYSELYQGYDVSTATAIELNSNVTTSSGFSAFSGEPALLCYDYIFSSAANDVRHLDISVKKTNEEQPVTKSVNNLDLKAANLTTVTGDYLN